jgi:Zn-finger nucleic acid-binding protein
VVKALGHRAEACPHCRGVLADTNEHSKDIFCHSERREESLFLSGRDSSLRCAPFRMT